MGTLGPAKFQLMNWLRLTAMFAQPMFRKRSTQTLPRNILRTQAVWLRKLSGYERPSMLISYVQSTAALWPGHCQAKDLAYHL